MCADEAKVICSGGVCGCDAGYYDSDGTTVGGACVNSKYCLICNGDLLKIEFFNLYMLLR